MSAAGVFWMSTGDTAIYATPEMAAARRAPGADLCADPECDLSGGFAHLGDCTPCSCGMEHAAAECPERSP